MRGFSGVTGRLGAVAGIALLALAITVPAASAAQSHYKRWSDPNTGADASSTDAQPPGDVDSLLERLRSLVDEATQSQAADPRFLQDLRDLISDYERPTRRLIVSDTFADGNYTHNPTWDVLHGKYWVEKGKGLHNKVAAAGDSGGGSPDSAALRMLGAILQGSSSTQRTASPAGDAIALPAAIPNAFSIQVELTSWKTNGHLELGVYQGRNDRVGYRIVYEPQTPLRLVRVSAHGESTIEQSLHPVIMEDQQSHILTLTRGTDGTMSVSFDGAPLIKVEDQSLKTPFDGVRMSDKGGDFVLGSIKVWGLK